MEDQVGLVVVGGGVTVDEDQAVAAVVVDKAGGGVDGEAGSGDHEKVGMMDGHDGLFDGGLVKTFLVEDHIGFHGAAAGAFGDAFAVSDEFGGVEFSAAGAIVSKDGAVELIDFFTASFLMEAIDVLGDDGGELSLLFPFG